MGITHYGPEETIVLRIPKQISLQFLGKVLKPVAAYCLRHSIRVQEILESLKIALIREAYAELQRTQEEATVSRVSIMTGIHRKDVDRLSKQFTGLPSTPDLISKVIGHWQLNKEFCTKSGQPRVLSVGGPDSEFASLVREVSKELNAATVLFELERTKVIELRDRGCKLVLETYSPQDKLELGLQTLASDVEDLMSAVEQNLAQSSPIPNLHARTVFDRVRVDDIEQIRAWLVKSGHELHKKLRDFLGKRDQDINPNPKYRGKFIKVTLGSFSRIQEEDSELNEQ